MQQTVETAGYRPGVEPDAFMHADVYRVRAGTVRNWDVYQEPASAPIASFDDKASALNYAMCLARGRVAWHLLLRPATAPERNGNAREKAPRRH